MDDKKEYGRELASLFETREKISTPLAKILQVEAYDTDYGIRDYEGSVTGLDYVKMNPAEETNANSLLYDAIRKFGKRNIAKTFGLSLTDFLELPRDIGEHIMTVALEIAKERSASIENAMDELDEHKP